MQGPFIFNATQKMLSAAECRPVLFFASHCAYANLAQKSVRWNLDAFDTSLKSIGGSVVDLMNTESRKTKTAVY